MDDDFNTPLALAALFDLAREANKEMAGKASSPAALAAFGAAFARLGGQVLGLSFDAPAAAGADAMDRVVQVLIAQRAEARKARDFKRADAIRDRLQEAGVVLEDTPDGTAWRLE
jgi:cysteinyl-tRNA synthetase